MIDLLFRKVPLATERSQRGGREAMFQEMVAVTPVRDGASWAGVMAVAMETSVWDLVLGHQRG